MPERCTLNPDPARLSGLLDGTLTQQEDQRLRIHVEDCPTCRAAYQELEALREVTMTTRFVEPDESELGESPKGGLSLGIRGIGWILGCAWLAVAAGWGLWQAWQGEPDAFVRFLAFGGLGGALLLFLSVLIDRVVESRSDRYREVKR